MTNPEQSSPEVGRSLGNIFVNVTGETTITNRQDGEQEVRKKVINRTESGPVQKDG